jgi:D-amino-acid oxidase
MPQDVAVIGAGVIGLTSAIELLRSGHNVTIFARERPADTTSAVPAAIWFPYHARPEADVNRWALATRERLRALVGEPSGVRWVDFSRVWVNSPPPVESWAKPDDIIWLKKEELPPGFNFGYRVSVPLMENPTYMRYLRDLFLKLGGTFEDGEVAAITAIPLSYSTVVNCSGYGAKALCFDPELRPGRGVIVLADRITSERHLVHDEHVETLMYVVSRAGDCVLGGCDVTSDTFAASRDEAAAILRRCAVVEGCGDVRVNSVEVGIRPIRDSGVCLRAMVVNGRTVVHNYGHGGAGFTLSWGCAQDVVAFVGEPALRLSPCCGDSHIAGLVRPPNSFAANLRGQGPRPEAQRRAGCRHAPRTAAREREQAACRRPN